MSSGASTTVTVPHWLITYKATLWWLKFLNCSVCPYEEKALTSAHHQSTGLTDLNQLSANLILRQSNNAGSQFSAPLGSKWATDFYWNFWEWRLTHCKFSISQIWVMKSDCLRIQASQTVDKIIIHTLNTSDNKDKVRQCTLSLPSGPNFFKNHFLRRVNMRIIIFKNPII